MSLVNMQGKFIVKAGGAGGGGGISAPSNVAISNKSSSGFTVTWDSVASALGYKLDVATDSGFSSFVTGYNAKDVAGTSQAVTGLTQNTAYYVRVRAVAAGSNSGAVSDTTETVTLLNPGLLNGLQAFYKLDDTTDASGNGRTLTNNNGVSFSSGKIGNAATFNGANNNLELNENLLAGKSEVTISSWINTTDNDGYVIACGGLPGIIVVNEGGKFTFNTESGYSPVQSTQHVNDGTWHHLVATFSNGLINLYVDGTLSNTGNKSATIADSGISKTTIGQQPNDNWASFGGQIDAVGIWNRALNSTEVAELYNSGSGLE